MEVEIVQLSKWNEGWNWSDKPWHVFGGEEVCWLFGRESCWLVGWMWWRGDGAEQTGMNGKAGVKRELRALLRKSCCGCS